MTQSQLHAGTLAYTSPERLEGARAAETSDWYSVGVMLYEALVGTLPFPAETPVALHKAQKRPPIPPHKLNEKIPADLSELCLALLHPNPASRAGAADVAALASSTTDEEPVLGATFFDYGRKSFVGRRDEEKQLQKAFEQSSERGVSVLVEGVSGVGKTTLIEHFVSKAYDSRKALALRSRCHFQESVPYNGIDGIVDNLSRYLVLQSPEDLADAAPQHLNALLKVFPVLGRVPFPNRFRSQPLPTDPQVVLRRARAALRHLLTEVAKKRPLIVWIDDAQWCDLASISLLKEVFTGPKAPKNLLVLSSRSEDRSSSDVLSMLSGANPDGLPAPDVHLTLAPLAEGDIKTFMTDLGLVSSNGNADVMRQIFEETGGLPFFVVELAHHYRSKRPGDTHGTVNVGSMLKRRLVSLPTPLRSLLEIVAVSSGPLDEEAAMAVAGNGGGGAIYRLCGEHLLRKTLVRGQWSLESYHDRIRQIVLGLIPPESLRNLHHRIAEALSRRPGVDAETLVEHYRAAGDRLAAAEHAITGGRSAAERLAFDRAAELFKLAVDLRDSRDEDWPILVEEAQALANGGRPAEAAETYLEATRKAESLRCDSNEISAVKVKAAEQFVTGGFLVTGLSVLGGVFDDLKLPFPSGPRSAQLMSLKNHLRFLWQLRRVEPRELTETPPEMLLRLDTLWVASRSIGMLDTSAAGEAMVSWYLIEAARHRDRSRLLRALALEASVYANLGTRWSMRRSASLLRWAEDLLQESCDPYDHAWVKLAHAISAWFGGRWRSSVESAREAVDQLRNECKGVNWDVAVSQSFGLAAQVFLGDFRALNEAIPGLLDDAERRGDRYVATVFRSGYLVFLPLADDRSADALRAAEATLQDIPQDHFTAFHFHHFNAATNALLYEGDAWRAWSLIEDRWPLIRQAGLHHLACIGSLLRDVRARGALAAAEAGASKQFPQWTRRQLLKVALKEANAIASRSLPHAGAMAAGIRAGAAGLRGDQSGEEAQLETAISGFTTAEMTIHHAAARIRLGALLGGQQGSDMVAASKSFLAAQGVRNPERMTALLFPGA